MGGFFHFGEGLIHWEIPLIGGGSHPLGYSLLLQGLSYLRGGPSFFGVPSYLGGRVSSIGVSSPMWGGPSYWVVPIWGGVPCFWGRPFYLGRGSILLEWGPSYSGDPPTLGSTPLLVGATPTPSPPPFPPLIFEPPPFIFAPPPSLTPDLQWLLLHRPAPPLLQDGPQ